MSVHREILEAVAVTAELTGTELSAAAQAVMVRDLLGYPKESVLRALSRCRRELTGRLTLAAILDRLDDGRPGADEAWGVVARALGDESETVVWTEEMASAAAPARELMMLGDKIGARMAFRDAYERIVSDARGERRSVSWRVSAGNDADRRASAIVRAVELGRLPAGQAQALLPAQAVEERHLLLTGSVMSDAERRSGREQVKKLLAMLQGGRMQIAQAEG
ncbi:hypothetical protein [Chromobacterium vaccinii]|uniref:hypothetical protein n=1 Tax=Chromobacterium vaccinii TaxID=1108595 RepID=UPI00345A247B|nr:Uncharacterized protein ChrSW_1532 [Chromobacterium vaccinii]QND88990.1 Uncharacterized protein ChrSV_1532 [Chromobacterium vaccinii]